MTLEERDGVTYYQTLVQHDSKEARDMHLQSGMEKGAAIALDRLEAIAQSLTSGAASPESRTSGAAAPRAT